jgi:acetyl esterase/lipase
MGQVLLTSNVAFADNLGLDIYAPRRQAGDKRVALFFYGGGWDSGDKALYPFVGAALASRGVTTVIPSYRVYPEVRFPGFLCDAALAVRWAIDTLCTGGERPVLIGHSAGAHIAAMLAFDQHWLGEVNLAPSRNIAGLVGLSGPYDFLPLRSAKLKSIFGSEQGLAATQPINFVTPTAPPALLATGRLDRIVDPQNSVRLARRIRTAAGSVELRLYPLAAHASLIGAFAWPLRPLAAVLKETLTFVEAVSGQTRALP